MERDAVTRAAPVPITRRVILGNAFALTAGSATAQGLAAVAVLLTARQLGAETFGRYTAAFSVAAFTAIAFTLGLDTWLLRSGAREPDRLGGFLGNALAVKLTAGILWLAGLVIILPRLNPNTFSTSLMVIAGVTIWAEGLLAAMLAAFKALLRNQVPVWAMIGLRGAMLALTGLLIAIGATELTGYALGRMGIAVVCAAIVFRLLPFTLRMRVREWPALGRATLPFAASDLSAAVYIQADTTLAAIMLGSAAVGLYAPASSLVNALFVVPAALYTLLIPVLVRSLDVQGALGGKMIGRTLGAFAFLGGALWVAVWAASGSLLASLLGDSFQGSGPLLAILSPILFLKSLNFGSAAILVAVSWQGRRAYVQAVVAAVNVGLNVLLIPHFGVTGVAWIYAISELLLAFGYLGLVIASPRLRRSGKSTNDKH